MEPKEVKLIHIAEMFDSVQGEGLYTGTRMFFIRLAGCTVGKRPSDESLQQNPLPEYIEECRTWDGRAFLCDTNYRRTASFTVPELLTLLPVNIKYVCITGGEPLAQRNVRDLVEAIECHDILVHIETSGTVDPGWIHESSFNGVWVTVSPKIGVLKKMMHRANEVKLLVDENFKAELNVLTGVGWNTLVYVQPVNKEHSVDSGNLLRCFELLKEKPLWRLSIQLHKVLGVR